MKKRTAGILLGVMVSSMLLSACGKNEAKEAANESAAVEEEGVGERTEDGEKVETDSAVDTARETEKSSSSENTDIQNKEQEENTQTKSEEESSAEKEETEEIEEAEPEYTGKVGVLFPAQEGFEAEAEAMSQQLTSAKYEADVQSADGDCAVQISQIESLIEEGASALIIDPVDPYALTDVLASAKDGGIPVFSYDTMIRDTAAVNYYASFDTRAIGKQIADEIIKGMDLDKARGDKESYTIEFLMGSPDDNNALFLCNGIQEGLREYLEDGTLVCKSGKTSFDDTAVMRWSENSAKEAFSSVLMESYAQEGTPDIICTASDAFTYVVEELLEEKGLTPDDENWPLITGYGSEAQAVKNLAEGKLNFTVYTDKAELAKGCAEMVTDYLTDEKVNVTDYSQYDNGVKILGTFTLEGEIIDVDNYQILVDNGTYSEEEIRPDPTPTSQSTDVPDQEEDSAQMSKPGDAVVSPAETQKPETVDSTQKPETEKEVKSNL